MRTDLIAHFRNRLATGAVIGPFCKTGDPAMIEALGYGGMDFVILDLEHGPQDNAALGGMIRAAELASTLPVVRVGSIKDIGRALDQGALAVQVPHVSNADDARAVVSAARFAPHGQRGVCRYVRAACYGTQDRFSYFKEANEALVILQVEGREGLANLDAIMDVAGVDIIFLGVYDLSQSLGHTGAVDHPEVLEALKSVASKGRERGRTVGTFVEGVKTARAMRDLGLSYLCYGVDVGLISDAAHGVVTAIRESS